MNITLYGLVWLFYRTVNKRREQIWTGWTEEVSQMVWFSLFCTSLISVKERQDYLKTTKDQGNKRLDFRFVY